MDKMNTFQEIGSHVKILISMPCKNFNMTFPRIVSDFVKYVYCKLDSLYNDQIFIVRLAT